MFWDRFRAALLLLEASVGSGYLVAACFQMGFKGWLLKHDLEKGSLDLSTGKSFGSKSIEKVRKDYVESLEDTIDAKDETEAEAE